MATNQTIIIKKKKGGGGHGHHGGAWKVAYADFVTAMMCFFLVMWLMGSDEETKKAIEHYFNHPNTPYKAGADPSSNQVRPMGEKEGSGQNVLSGAAGLWPEDLITRPAPQREIMKEAMTLSKMIQELLDGKVQSIDIHQNKIRFSLSEKVLFKKGSADLEKSGLENLALLGNLLKNFSGYINIEGHTDETPPRGSRYSTDWELSFARAVMVMEFFVEVNKMNAKHLTPVGWGSRRPATVSKADVNPEKNRRVEFILSYDGTEE